MIRLEWTEYRFENGEWDSFWVVASKGSGEWKIVERDRWDSKSYPVLTAVKPRYERIAEYAQRGFSEGFVQPGTIVALLVDRRNLAACEIYNLPASMRSKNWKNPSKVFIEVSFGTIKGLPVRDAALGNDIAA